MAETSSSVEVEAQFNAIVDEFGRFLRNTVARLCPKDLGLQHSDIEQEARIRLWRALQSGREISDPASYIYRIAATTTIDAIRRVKARREEQLRVADDEEEKAVLHLAAPAEHSPDRLAERRQMLGKVQEAFGRLADNRRSAVVLYLEGLTSDEIARGLGWSEPKARHLVYRGLGDLRRQLKAEGIECEID
jgi:RNA polymerase sigma-70 factor (ECF subfamily)